MTGGDGSQTTAVLLLAYGGPERLEDVEPFLRDIRGGRPTPAELVEEVRGRYAAIGGRSPLLDITRAQARALEERLNRESDRSWRTFVGMRHWHPYVHQTVGEIAEAGIRRAVALCLAPQYSRMSIGAYFAALDRALATTGADLEVTRVASWSDHPGFLDAVAQKVVAGLESWPREERGDVLVLFTAHSLPRKIVRQGDPYDDQLRATAGAVAERVERRTGSALDWTFCYQSAGAGAVDWLGPQIEQVVVERARSGHRDLLAAPIGFVADHVEVLFDLDVEARELAEAEGARFERTESLNTTPAFIAALTDVVRTAG